MKRKTTNSFVTAHLLLLVTLAITPAFAETRYVDATNGNNANSGTAWNQAYKTLAHALRAAHQTPAITEIRVAEGTYYPEDKAGDGTDERHKAFTITRAGLTLLGGYPAGGNGVRNPDAHPTIMSGDIGSQGERFDNAYHVLITAGSTIDASLKLDGFTIKEGKASGPFYYGSLTIDGLDEIFDSDGGGWYNLLGSPQLNNVKIIDNDANHKGGGVHNAGGSPTVTNFTLSYNTTFQEGGGWYNSSGNPVLKNGVMQTNNAQSGGGVWANITGNPLIQNCLINNEINDVSWAGFLLNRQGQPSFINCTIVNNGNGYQTIYSEHPNTYFSNCIIWGLREYPEYFSENVIYANSIVNRSGGSNNWNGPSHSDGGGNLDVDPLFVNPGGGNYRLKRSSPAINAGKNSLIADQSTPDLDGNTRIFGANVDMGTYENHAPLPASGTLYVDASVTTPGIGDSWTTAIPSLAEAIGIAHVSHVSIDKILVAEGTYYPEYKAGNGTDERHKAFTITRAGLEILGGYPAGGHGARDPDAHPTIMSGDLGSKGEHFDNACHVLITAGSTIDASLKLDGFTIKEGNATRLYYYESVIINGLNGISDNDGGGWYNLLGSPQLNNVKIRDNFADNNGAGVYNAGGNPTLTNFTLSDNRAGEEGGGWYNASDSPVLKNGVIQRNRANYGGGVWVNITGNPLIQNCLITEGSSGAGPGEFLLHKDGQPSVINCTIVNNGGGYRLISTGQTDTYISNCIIWGPRDYLEPYSDKIIFANSIVVGSGGSTNWNGPSRSDGGGNLDVDPLFVNPGGGDYRLQLSSPAINAGKNSLIADQSTPDLDGNPRVFGANVDMGAYEIQTPRPTSGTIHVDASVTTPGNGDSWATAIPSLAEAIRIAHESYVSVNKILVAEGTYYPEYKAGDGITDRHKAFTITRNSLEILGGYPAGGNGDRDPNAHPTILSGDIGVPDNNSDNAYHVLITVGPDADASLKLDGFTITDGNADGAQGERLTIGDYDEIRSARGGGWYNVFANPQLNAIKITGNRSGQLGGGVFNEGGSPTVTNTTISNNAAVGGAGWYNNLGNPIVTNAVIRENSATGPGGGWSNSGGNSYLQNVLITANAGGSSGASAWHNYSGNPSLVNCTITGNSGGVTSIWSNNSRINVSNSIVWGPNNTDFFENISEINYTKSIVRGSGGSTNWNYEAGYDNGGNLDMDPLFVNPTTGDYRLQSCSPAIDAGNNSLITDQSLPDLDGNSRISGTQVDMGAYEYDNLGAQPDPITIYVDASVTAPGNGQSWATAFSSLAEAIKLAHQTCINVEKILVAEGTYYPEYKAGNGTHERHKAFTITRAGLEVLGGYPAGGNGPRDPDKHPTIMSGDIGVRGDHDDNVYHVLITVGRNIDTSLKLDGFTVRDGNAYGHREDWLAVNDFNYVGSARGGGWYNVNGNPQLSRMKISNNRSGHFGGGVFNEDGNPTLINSIVSENSSEYGGAWYNYSGNSVLRNVVIQSNSVSRDGGGWYNNRGNSFGENLLFTGNSANWDGSAWNNNMGNSSLLNSTIVGNLSTNLLASSVETLNVSNSIIWVPTGYNRIAHQKNISFTDCIVRNSGGSSNWNNNWGGDNGGNLDMDPLFVNGPAGDYRLQACSPAIDAGNTSLVPDQSLPDLAGNRRILGARVDMGAYEFTGATSELAVDQDEVTTTVDGDAFLLTNGAGCKLIAYLSPNGTTSVAGEVAAKVWVETSQQNFVKRHYQITPTVGAENATARVTLYFTQQEFTDFNAVNPVKLPVDPEDAENYKANLRIEKRAGTSSNGLGLPGSYNGEVATINPLDPTVNGNVIWNTEGEWWEVSFDVTGFSGFFVKTTDTPLPLNMLSFTGTNEKGVNLLTWETAAEINTLNFEVQRSTDAKKFTKIGTVNTNGSGNHRYSYHDAAGNYGNLYYRLKMNDIDGSFAYSKIISLSSDDPVPAFIYPNPAKETVTLTVPPRLKHSVANLYDATGRLVQTIAITSDKQKISLYSFSSGVYTLKFADGSTVRVVKQ